jgi:hypothetical protein
MDLDLNYGGVQAAVCVRVIFRHSALKITGWRVSGLVTLVTECPHVHAMVRSPTVNLSVCQSVALRVLC